MQIFEFHFNPRPKEEIIFDSFIYEPENVYERKLGNLYIAGELTNALPQNYRLLNNLALAIKESYYHLSSEASSEKALKKSLKKANDFLKDQEKEGNVSWLGNLNIAAVSIKDFYLNFTKVGNIKILLARGNQLTDISRELEVREPNNSPLKVFSNIISGKLAPGDKIIILTKEVSNLFDKEEIFPEILSIFEEDLTPERTDRELRKILNRKKGILTNNSGLFLLIVLEGIKEKSPRAEEESAPKKKTALKSSSFLPFPKIKKGVIAIIINRIAFTKKIWEYGRDRAPLSAIPEKIKDILTLPKKKLPGAIKKPGIALPKNILSLPKDFPSLKTSNLKLLIISIFILVIILGLGNHIFKENKQREIEEVQAALSEIQKTMDDAENALIFNDEKRANLLYQEAWNEILALTQEEDLPLEEEVLSLKESIEKELFPINKIEKINDPQITFEFKPEEFSPQKMIISGSNIYFFNPGSDRIYVLDMKNKEGKSIQVPAKIKLGAAFGDSVIFYSETNQLFFLKGEAITSARTLSPPYPDSNFQHLSTFGSNIYFLDKKGEIVKFKSEPSGEIWLKPESKKPLTAKSMAIDGSIWILNEDNTLSKYYLGEFKGDVALAFFPVIQGDAKLFAQSNLLYLYLLTPDQNRVVITDKNGEIIKQYRSDKFDNLKDVALSENGSIIYLLNGLKIYQVGF